MQPFLRSGIPTSPSSRHHGSRIGHHGEPGLAACRSTPLWFPAEHMTSIILPDLPFDSGDQVVVLVSGLGSTPLMEQFIFFNKVHQILGSKGISIYRSYVGNYFTSLEMAGLTLTIMRLDEELRQCVDYEADSMGLRQFAR